MIRHHNIGRSEADRPGDLIPGYAAVQLSRRRGRLGRASGLLIALAVLLLAGLVALLAGAVG